METLLAQVLPCHADLVDNLHVYEFLLQGWALLSCSHEMGVSKYWAAYGNLQDLADALSEYIDIPATHRCSALLEAIRALRAHKISRRKIKHALGRAENTVFVEIHYRKEIMMNRLHMYRDLGQQGAFGISRGSDMIQLMDILLEDQNGVLALDLGSGNGFSTFALSQKVAHVTGVEIDAGLYQESLICLQALSRKRKIEASKIRFIHADFFDMDFSPYTFIYIYWPYEHPNKQLWEQNLRTKLAHKINMEAKPGTLITAFIPGMGEKHLFPGLKRVLLDTGSISTVVEVYQVG